MSHNYDSICVLLTDFGGLLVAANFKLIILKKNFVEVIFFLLLSPMKIVPNRKLIYLGVLLVSAALQAAPGPPPPSSPPPPPGLPLDGNLFVLITASLLLGVYKLYKINVNNKKASDL